MAVRWVRVMDKDEETAKFHEQMHAADMVENALCAIAEMNRAASEAEPT